ncbi:hypothetical protein FEM48_Zijuj12G0166800 [Ziziphus jujuba var. spinosa]|uniref:Helicase ATP-binding domain-containing protein n=1 Tax=Ziziphus jujuba var. spinosa TaxID=714518 RepID=A0A978UEG4_ZIZJJ|nr:hypothetical protein FEM48_Zijuj12G0166800 [Ziziphus jujuba var. spinosa]
MDEASDVRQSGFALLGDLARAIGSSRCIPQDPQGHLECKRKVIFFPSLRASSLSWVEKQLSEISGAKVQVKNLDPLVHRAIAAALAIPDLQVNNLVSFDAIGVASCIRDSWPVLIMVPSSLRLQWASIIQQWLDIPPFDILVVIADELHFLKNAQAKRTTAFVPVIKKAQYARLPIGTPALSWPIELFKQLEALYPDVFTSVHECGNRYCKGV